MHILHPAFHLNTTLGFLSITTLTPHVNFPIPFTLPIIILCHASEESSLSFRRRTLFSRRIVPSISKPTRMDFLR